jgi:antitoxin PrlF
LEETFYRPKTIDSGQSESSFLRPGSVLEWTDEDGKIVIRRVGRYTSEDVHRALFPETPEPRTVEVLKEGARKAMKSRHGLR